MGEEKKTSISLFVSDIDHEIILLGRAKQKCYQKLKQTGTLHNACNPTPSTVHLSVPPTHPHSPDPLPSSPRKSGQRWTLIRSCVLNTVVPASLNFHCYGDKGRHKAYRSPGSLHSTSFAHYCRHRNSFPSSPPGDPSHSVRVNRVLMAV